MWLRQRPRIIPSKSGGIVINKTLIIVLIFALCSFPTGGGAHLIHQTSQKIIGSSAAGEIIASGDRSKEGSLRFGVYPDTGVMGPQKLIDGIWQPGPWAVGPDTLWIGKYIGWAAAGHYVMIEDADGGFHFYAHSQFDGEVSISDTRMLYAYYFSERQISQPDDLNEWIGTEFTWMEQSSTHGLLKKGYWKTGSIAATKPIRIQTWRGIDENGSLEFDQVYPVSHFLANSEVITIEKGFIELQPGLTYFTKISSENNFSLLTNAEETKPWNAIDIILVRYHHLLQTPEWVDGAAYTEDQLFITDRKIYVCNVTGVQTGTFEDNSDKWSDLGDKYIENYFTPGAIPYAGSDGKLTEDPTNLFYDAASYFHTPKLAIFDDDAILKRGHGLSIIRGADADVDIIHVNTQSTSAYYRYDFSEDMFWFDKGLRIRAYDTDEADLDIENGKLIVNAIEIVGIDGEVNKAAIEDSENWDEAYSWDDHSLFGYLTEEVDPVFTAWDKSTGISITESQVSDLVHTPAFDGDITEIYNSAGLFKIQPDVQGDVELFGDTDVGNVEVGKMLYVRRQAVEGDNYVRFYVNHDTTGTIAASSSLTAYGEDSVTLHSGAENIIFRVGDDAGTKGTYFKNSSNAIVGVVDSLGNAQFNSSIDVPEISNTASLLKIQPDAQGDVELFGDTDVGNNDNSKILKVWRRAPEGNDYIRFYISDGRNAYIHASNNLTLQAQVPFTINSVTDDIIFKVGDSSGDKKFRFKDSDGANVATLDSNGNAWFDGNVGIGTDNPTAKLEISNIVLHDNYKALAFSDDGDDTYYFYANYAGTGQTGNWVTFSDVWGNDIQTWRDGNVGIGTTNPDYALHLYRTDEHSVLQIEAAGASHGEANLFFKTQSDPGWQIFMDDSNLSVLGAADRLGFFHYGSAATRMVIDGSSGNVGIGTTDPKEELHIKSDHPTIAFEEADGSSNEKVWEFGAAGDEFLFRTANDLHTGNQTIFKAMNRGGTSVSTFAIPNAQVTIGTEISSGELTVDQSNASGAIAVLTLDQGDADQPFIEFLGGIVLAGKSGLDEYLEINVNGNARHLRLFN